MKKALLFLSLFFCLAIIPANAKKDNDSGLLKAYEYLYVDGDLENALDVVNDVLEKSPKDASALRLRAEIYYDLDDYRNALKDINLAIKYNNPKQSKIYNSTLHWLKASIYEVLLDYENQIAELKIALDFAKTDNPDNVRSILFDIGNALYWTGKYNESSGIFQEILDSDETDVAAMTGIARNLIKFKSYEEAAAMMEKAKALDEDYISSYKFAAQAYDKLGNTVKAIDNAITLIEIDFDEYTQTIGDMFLKNKNYAVAKIREKIKNSESNETWKLILVELYRGTCDYDKAIKIINEFESEQGSDALFNEYRGDYYYEMGLNQKAISEYELALNDGNNNDSSLWSKIGTAYYAMGKYSEADEYFRKYIEENPLNEYGYILLGQNCEMSGDNDSALDLYNQAVDMEQENPISYFLRGKLYLKNGDKAKAAEDFNKEVELDTVCCSSSSRAFSLFYLGREKEAFEWMDATVATEPYKTGSWYNQACLYSLTGRHDEAVAALEKALQMGYCDFLHIGIDSDLDGIRDRDDFKNLISKYSAKLQEKISALMQEEEKTSQKSLITEIDFKRHRGGTFEIPCKVNGLELKMIFDTGASDVSISIVEANFMLKNNYLSKNDIKGTKYYMNANGEISEGTTIILKEIKVGDAVMKNVAASVVESQDAPLLLGQSVMERFGTITIDNINNKLIIKQ